MNLSQTRKPGGDPAFVFVVSEWQLRTVVVVRAHISNAANRSGFAVAWAIGNRREIVVIRSRQLYIPRIDVISMGVL